MLHIKQKSPEPVMHDNMTTVFQSFTFYIMKFHSIAHPFTATLYKPYTRHTTPILGSDTNHKTIVSDTAELPGQTSVAMEENSNSEKYSIQAIINPSSKQQVFKKD